MVPTVLMLRSVTNPAAPNTNILLELIASNFPSPSRSANQSPAPLVPPLASGGIATDTFAANDAGERVPPNPKLR
jgi:hypothetical protein